ncbi:pyrroline-5-carboxylate reductase [soil metagenome]
MASIAIFGVGVIGEMLLSALLEGGIPPSDIVVTEKRADNAARITATHGVTVVDNSVAAHEADLLLIVVKPQDVFGLLDEIGSSIRPGSTLISLAAGITTASIEAVVPEGVAVIRVMPNTPALVGEGMYGVSAGSSVSDAQLEAAVSLLRSSGKVLVIPEADQNALTAVSGSGPAYIFLVAEAMIAAGVAAGLSAETAHDLTVQTVVGSAKLLAASDVGPEILRQRVTSPQGTTAEAIAVLEERGLRKAFEDAIAAAVARAAELSA